MKNWDAKDFAPGSSASLTSKMVQRRLPEGAEANHAWLASLPIAAAIYQLGEAGVSRASTNRLFEGIAAGTGRTAAFDLAACEDAMLDMLASGRPTHFQLWRSDDKVSPCEMEISIAIFGADRDHFLLSLVDRTAEVVSRSNLRREMMNDSLTGFANRIGFEDRIEDAASALANTAAGSMFALVVFDLARFSRINESVGVLAGDELIITVARRLSSRLRTNEIIGRMGGNEFALFAMVDDVSAAEAIADRIVRAFEDPCKLSNLEIQIDCAVAAATGVVGDEDPMDVLRHAQIALKKAKQSKKFELFSNDKLDRAKHRFSIETDLRRALERDELELHYQPLIDLESGRLNGFEALARWNHPDRGPISPMDFIPVAEESGLIVPLGRWALAEAARTISAWEAASASDLPVKISVNLSAVQLLRDDVPKAVEEAIRNAGIHGNRLTLELTESAFVDDPDGARRVLDALKALDTNLAMDDFGTGYSNLAYLQKLPIDVLKIDRSFITDLTANKDSRAIVSTVLSLASALGMKTTAEGIESEEISAELRRLGCTNGQGYFYAKPLNGAAAYEFLVANKASATA
jgi:c-di-GMP phosphodiesterase Gmr